MLTETDVFANVLADALVPVAAIANAATDAAAAVDDDDIVVQLT